MNPLLERAIEVAKAHDELPPIVMAPSGAIIPRHDENSDWRPIREAAILPLIAGEDFLVAVEAAVVRGDHAADKVQPVDNPYAEEVRLHYLWQAGDLTEVWVVPIHRADDGARTFGEPEQITVTELTSPRGRLLGDLVRALAIPGLFKRDAELEHDIGSQLASRGHVVMWAPGGHEKEQL